MKQGEISHSMAVPWPCYSISSWTSWSFCWPISSACWGPSEQQHVLFPAYTHYIDIPIYSIDLTFSIWCNWYFSKLSYTLTWQKFSSHAIEHNSGMYFGRELLHPTPPWGQHCLYCHFSPWLCRWKHLSSVKHQCAASILQINSLFKNSINGLMTHSG